LFTGATYKVIVDHFLSRNSEGISWASVKTIAERTGLHRDVVKKSRTELVLNGWLRPLGLVQPRGTRAQFGVQGYKPLIPAGIFSPHGQKTVADKYLDAGGRNYPSTVGINHPPQEESKNEESKNEVKARAKSRPALPELFVPCVTHCRVTWEDKVGAKPTWGAKDERQLSRVLRQHPELAFEEFKARWGRFLDDDDRWLAKMGYSLAWFCSRFDAYADGVFGVGTIPEAVSPY
jgi:Helix-turn-helix domain